MYREVTRKIEVTVTPEFLADRSAPKESYYFWAYTIEIANHGQETVQLKTRHWRITDAHGRMQEVKGPGVVGHVAQVCCWGCILPRTLTNQRWCIRRSRARRPKQAAA